jgi:hypothetical protein
MNPTLDDATVAESFYEPALALVRDYCRLRRDGLALSDERFLRSGIQRVMGQCDSGRDFLQARQDRGDKLNRSTWFDALHSPRRSAMVAEVATNSYEIFTRHLAQRDWLAAFPELHGRAVWAVDGHQIAHACHAIPDAKGEQVPVGELYGMCLHSGLLRAMATFQGNGERRHEWPVFKQHLPVWLRQDRGRGLPLIVGDPAYIDILYWSEQKRLKQAAVITREKENMKPTVIGSNRFDPDDPINRGVEADETAGYTSAYLRRIVFRDPASGEVFVFLTTDHSLRPGVVALLYLLRWKIEKAYDVFKNKFHQQKAWATGKTAAHSQAHLIALTHNLLTILLCNLELIGITETKGQARLEKERSKTPAAQRVPSRECVQHAIQLTCQFIRLVRHCLDHKTRWIDALPLFQQRLSGYL